MPHCGTCVIPNFEVLMFFTIRQTGCNRGAKDREDGEGGAKGEKVGRGCKELGSP